MYRYSLIVFFIIFVTSLALADIPKEISYQGKILDSAGSPIADGEHTIVFNIFTDETGGSLFWMETATVQTIEGLFSHNIGSIDPIGNPLDQSIFRDNSQLYLEMYVDGEIQSPRTKLSSVPYAFQSLNSENALIAESVITDGIDNTSIIDEPGIVRSASTNVVEILDGSVSNLESATIIAPGPGFIVVHGYATIIFKSQAVSPFGYSTAVFGILHAPTINPSTTLNNTTIGYNGENATSGNINRYHSLVVEATFEIGSAGSYSYYLNAFKNIGVAYTGASNSRLLLVYYPKAYGTVEESNW